MSTETKPGEMTDFSDRLSPMLVKELRQGMRTNLFTVAFILLQAFMVLCVLLGASSPGSSDVSEFFWFFIIVALLIVMPIRGFSALTSEINLNTMDLIQLTRLGAWRITFGKWAALVSQTLLLVCGILPYLVMRYFLGGVDLISELWGLFAIVLVSMVVTAVTVGFSAFRSVLLRVAVVAGLAFVTIGMGNMIYFIPRGMGIGRVMGFGTVLPTGFWWMIAAIIFSCFYAIFFLLDLGASRIAPDAENHATRKRVAALIYLFLIMLLPATGVPWEFSVSLSVVVIIAVSVDAITERPSLVPSVFRPFARWPLLRPFAPFLTPGWHTGIRFALLLGIAFSVFLWYHDPISFQDLQNQQILVSGAGIIMFPLLVIHLFFRKHTDAQTHLGIYVLIQCCTVLVAIFLTVLSEAIGEVAYALLPIPMMTFVAAMENDADPSLLVCAAVILAVSVIVPAWRSMPLGLATRKIFRLLGQPAEVSESTPPES